MRIAIFTDYYPPHVGGGVERVVGELARGLARRGEDVRVFSLATLPAPAFEVQDGVRVYRARTLQLTGLVGVQSALSPSLFTLALRELRREPADVMHAHGCFFFASLVAATLSRVLRTPLVTTLHIGSLEHLPKRQRLPSQAYERTMGRAIIAASREVICVSKAVAEHAATIGARPGRTCVIENGVDTEVFYPGAGAEAEDTDRVRLAFVGRLIENKGPHFFLQAAPAVIRAHPEAEFVFIGDGPMRRELAAKARRLGLQRNVRFEGLQHDVASRLRASDVYVRPSLTEGMPLTVLEAMACGLPVVATPVGGTAEIVYDGVNGLLVPPGDVPALASALIRLADRPKLRARLGAKGRALVRRSYSWQRVVDANLAVYQRIVSPEGGAALPGPA